MLDQQHTIFSIETIFDGTKYYQDRSITSDGIVAFKEAIWHYYNYNGRQFPWRQTANPYNIVVSEVMLQQTQTYRVEPKYLAFIQELDSFAALANAEQRDVIRLWQGLGYNRRALGLQKLACIVDRDFNGQLPQDPLVLETLPTLGHATARSVAAFAFNTPTTFIETNIRAVFIHTFFGVNCATAIHDKELVPLIEQTLDTHNSRLWYYALMDYGVMLKKLFKNPSRKSKHHTQQSKFEGSDRQIRGAILKLLTAHTTLSHQELMLLLCQTLNCEQERAERILNSMQQEQFVRAESNYYFL